MVDCRFAIRLNVRALSVIVYALAALAQGSANALYPYSRTTNNITSGDDDFSIVGTLTTPFILYGRGYQDVFVGINGQISFGSGTNASCTLSFPRGAPPLVTAFWNDINLDVGGVIYYELIDSMALLKDLFDRTLMNATNKDCLLFQPTSGLLVTWESVSQNNGSSDISNTFQVLLLTDGATSYVVFKYRDMAWGDGGGTIIGFNDGTRFYTLSGGEQVAIFSNVSDLPSSSNVGCNGTFVYRTDMKIQPGLDVQCEGLCYTESNSCQGNTTMLAQTASACCNTNPNGRCYKLENTPISCDGIVIKIVWHHRSNFVVHTITGFKLGFENLATNLTVTEGEFLELCVVFVHGLVANVTVTVTITVEAGDDFNVLEAAPHNEAYLSTACNEDQLEINPPSPVRTGESIVLFLNSSFRRQCVALEAILDGISEGVEELRIPLSFGSPVLLEDLCQLNEHQCLNETKCIPVEYMCDGIPDCPSGTEELNCSTSGGCVDDESRLVGGASATEGLLETCFSGTFRPVSAEGFTVREASAVCRQLGVPAGGVPVMVSETGSPVGSVLLNVSCQGEERNLTDCTISATRAPLENSSLTGVRCNADSDNLGAALNVLVNNFDEENYEDVVSILRSLTDASVTMLDEQTEENLDLIAAAFDNVARLLISNSSLPIEDDTIMNLVYVLDSIGQWDPEVLAANASNIIQDFESVAALFASQRSAQFEVITPGIAFITENLDLDELQTNGRSLSSMVVSGAPNPMTGNGFTAPVNLEPTQTGFVNLPPSLFERVPADHTRVGLFFAVYSRPTLFPPTERSVGTFSRETRVLSPVVAATVGSGLSFRNLSMEASVTVLLRLLDLEESIMAFGSERCVSWDFTANGFRGDWTTEGCVTVGLVDGVVTCECNHLTNFAILVDICARIDTADCGQPPALTRALTVLTILGVSFSLFGLSATIITLLTFKKLRKRDASKYHVQLCIAMICMLLVFVTGINRTTVYGGCVAVSVLLHYFTLVAVLWMAAEALLMFQKFVIVFVRIKTKFIVIVSICCWTLPLIPVIIPLIIDLSTRPEQDIVIDRENFCFLSHAGAFFGAFLAPIFALLIFNFVMFITVAVILSRHTKVTIEHQEKGMKKQAVVHYLISIAGVVVLFGLTWLFGALTITVTSVNLLFQVLFVVFNSFQGFFIFLFLCVFSNEARESWKEACCCGRYKSEYLRPSNSNASKKQSGNSNAARVRTVFTQDKSETPASHTECDFSVSVEKSSMQTFTNSAEAPNVGTSKETDI